MTDNEPYWTLAETVVWICTRDLTRVSSIADIRSDAALGEEIYKLLSEKTLTIVDPPDLNEIRDGAPKANWNVSGLADDQIIEWARDGNVRAIGRRKWEGPLERIPPAEFIGLRIRTIPDGLERGQSIDWLDVQFRRADVMQQWPSGLAMAPALEGQDGEPTVEPRKSTQPHHEPPANQDEPAPHTAAEIDVTQDGAREAEHDALDDAGDGIDRSRIRPTEFTPEEQSKGGSKPKIHFGLLEYLERLCDSGLAADFRKRSDITLGEIEQILTAFAKGGPVEDRVDIIINDFEHARYDEIAKTLYWEDWMQEQNDKPRKRQQALKSLQPYLDIINRKKPRPEKQDTDLT